MENEMCSLMKVLNELDLKNYENYSYLEQLVTTENLISKILENLSEPTSLKLLRQLLQHIPQSVMDKLMIQESLPITLVQNIRNLGVDYNNIWILQELFDENYLDLIDTSILEILVNSLDKSEECEAIVLIKLLNHIAFEKLDLIMKLPNYRYFCEMILFRLNRSSGLEKRFYLIIVGKILDRFAESFYNNDLKILCDIVLDIIANKEEEEVLAYSVLEKILNVKEFFNIGYMFEEILEIINLPENDKEINSIQLRILTQITEASFN